MCDRNQQFEAEQTALHQKLSVLQTELAVLQQQYDLLLQQVDQQQRIIQQLTESQKYQNPTGNIPRLEPKDAEDGGECGLVDLNVKCGSI